MLRGLPERPSSSGLSRRASGGEPSFYVRLRGVDAERPVRLEVAVALDRQIQLAAHGGQFCQRDVAEFGAAPGSRRGSPLSRPLRTARASFPAHGSSLPKPLCRSRFRDSYVEAVRIAMAVTMHDDQIASQT